MPADPTASEVMRNRRLQERLGYGVLDLQTGSGVGFEDVRRYTYVTNPRLSPKATAIRLQRVLGRALSELEAVAAWDEILRHQRERMQEAGQDVPIEEAVREWDERYGLAFRRRWYLLRPEPSWHRYMPGGRERSPGVLGKAIGLGLPKLQPLLEGGFTLLDVLAAWYVARRVPKHKRHKRYIRLVAELTGWTLSVEEAAWVWGEVSRHKVRLGARLGYEVSLERATVDYIKRLRLSGLDRSVLWDTGQLLDPSRAEQIDEPLAPSTAPGGLFPA